MAMSTTSKLADQSLHGRSFCYAGQTNKNSSVSSLTFYLRKHQKIRDEQKLYLAGRAETSQEIQLIYRHRISVFCSWNGKRPWSWKTERTPCCLRWSAVFRIARWWQNNYQFLQTRILCLWQCKPSKSNITQESCRLRPAVNQRSQMCGDSFLCAAFARQFLPFFARVFSQFKLWQDQTQHLLSSENAKKLLSVLQWIILNILQIMPFSLAKIRTNSCKQQDPSPPPSTIQRKNTKQSTEILTSWEQRLLS